MVEDGTELQTNSLHHEIVFEGELRDDIGECDARAALGVGEHKVSWSLKGRWVASPMPTATARTHQAAGALACGDATGTVSLLA